MKSDAELMQRNIERINKRDHRALRVSTEHYLFLAAEIDRFKLLAANAASSAQEDYDPAAVAATAERILPHSIKQARAIAERMATASPAGEMRAALEDMDHWVKTHGGPSFDAMPCIRRMRKALAAAPAVTEEWQPIETAPKDGTQIDLWCRAPGITTGPGRTPDCWYFNGHWWRHDDSSFGGQDCKSQVHNASHWRPLPAPPTMIRGQGTGEKS